MKNLKLLTLMASLFLINSPAFAETSPTGGFEDTELSAQPSTKSIPKKQITYKMLSVSKINYTSIGLLIGFLGGMFITSTLIIFNFEKMMDAISSWNSFGDLKDSIIGGLPSIILVFFSPFLGALLGRILGGWANSFAKEEAERIINFQEQPSLLV